MIKRPFRNKKAFKRAAGKCQICGENNYSVLDVHRIYVKGKDKGKYSHGNSVCLCAVCHRKEQAGQIRILGWVHSTVGDLLQWIDEEGNEQFS